MYVGRLFYNKGNFIILAVRRGYVVYNTEKEFNKGHTHLRNFKSAKNAIYFVINKNIPKESGLYFLTSLLRISSDEAYI